MSIRWKGVRLSLLCFLFPLASCVTVPHDFAPAGDKELEIRLYNVKKKNKGIWAITLEYEWLGGKPIPGRLISRQWTSRFTQDRRVYANRPRGRLKTEHLSIENLTARMGKEGGILLRDYARNAAGESGSRIQICIERDDTRISDVLSIRLP